MKPEIDEAAVWQRVTAAAQEPPPVQPSSSSEGALLLALEAGKILGESYVALYRSGNSGYQALYQAQRQELLQLRGLFALHYGRNPAVPQKSPPTHSAYVQKIHWLLETQGQQQQRLASLSGCFSAPSSVLLSLLAERTITRWAWLLGELGRIS